MAHAAPRLSPLGRRLPADAPLASSIVHDLRTLLRLDVGRASQHLAAMLDSHTL
jgi:hypothetical protein